MIFAQTNRYSKRQDVFSPDNRQGASVAHAELLKAVLNYTSAEAVELFVNGAPNRLPAMNLEFLELCREFPDKSLRLRNLDQLGTISAESQYVFYVSGVFLSPLAQSRRAVGRTFPICCFSHALDIPIVSQFIPGALLLAEEHDVILTSSSAGKRTLQNMVTLSQDVIRQRFGNDQPERHARIETIPLGVDTNDLYPRDKKVARELLNLAVDETVLLYVGRLSEEHKADLEPLIIVLRELLRKHSEVSLLIAGHDHDNNYFTELDAMATRFGVRGKLRFCLNFQDFLKPYLYSACDIFISPSDNVQETFGIAVLEAMACGLPVVASDWSGYRDLIIHGRTGFLVPTLWNKSAADLVSGQAAWLSDSGRRHMLAQQTATMPTEMYRHVSTLISNADLRKEFGAEGMNRARNEFSWKSVVATHEALWAELWDRINLESKTARLESPVKIETRKRFVDDFDLLFGHFATSSIKAETVVSRSLLRSDLENALRLRPSKAAYESIDSAEIRRVVDRASIGPVSIRQLIRDGIAKDTLGVLWLVKKGFLGIVGDRVLNPEGFVI